MRIQSICIIGLVITSVSAQLVERRIDNILQQMTLSEKILQLHHEGGFNTADNTRLGIPGLIMADGPHGVRDGLATSFPVGIAMAATWDPAMITRVGKAMGEEFHGKGKHQALGPCIDLTRDPRNGRSSESSGEDPFLSAQITSALVRGIQSTPVIATVKHYNGVNRQNNRHNNNVTVTQRQLMEHYGLNFRTAVQRGGVLSVMNAYNLINGQKCAENYNLLTTILRDNWGFPFYVVSDWGSIWNSEAAIKAGCNIDMGSDHYLNELPGLVVSGAVSEADIDAALRKVLRTKLYAGLLDYYPPGDGAQVNSPEHQQIALEAARKSIVLLKNENALLPLNADSVSTIAVIGPSANVAQLDGSGSAYVTPFYSISPRQGIEDLIGSQNVLYAKGCDINSQDSSGFAQAKTITQLADVVVYFGGLDNTQEGEGYDRVGGSVELPGVQNELIKALAKVNPNIIVVLESGGICSVRSFIDRVPGLIYAFYPGQEGGNALADVLFGAYNPAGRLPVSMPQSDAQLPARNDDFTDDYGSGYRWYDATNQTPEYAFGYGLNYSSFHYDQISVQPVAANAGDPVTVQVQITNTSDRAGEEVVQLYLEDNESTLPMPQKQLKAFRRVAFAPGETKTIPFTLTADEFYIFDETANRYRVEPGTFTVRAGGASDNLPLTAVFTLLPVTEQPDLQVIQIRSVPPYPVAGDSVVFAALVKNEGTSASPAGTVHRVTFVINGQETVQSAYFDASIPAGGSALLEAGTCWPASIGDHSVNAMVDPENAILETIETNNTLSDTLAVIAAPPVNLALHRTVFVSSIEASGLEGEKAVDGFSGTRWSSQFSDPQYITVDLGQPQSIGSITLNWESAYGKAYEIRVSDDNALWQTVHNENNSDGGIDRININANARYIQMYGLVRGTEWGYSLYEFEIYADQSTGLPNKPTQETVDRLQLFPLYPNPFNGQTMIRYAIDQPGAVHIKIFNTLGQQVQSFTELPATSGQFRLLWNGKDAAGRVLPSGVYWLMAQAGNLSRSQKAILLR